MYTKSFHFAMLFGALMVSHASFAADDWREQIVSISGRHIHVSEAQEEEAKNLKGELSDEKHVTKKNVAVFHASNVLEFIKRTGFGLDRIISAGEYVPKENQPFKTDLYSVEKRELIGLLTHPNPVVYDAPHKPVSINFMNSDVKKFDKADFRTRPLNTFENESLTKLKSGSDFVVEDKSPEIRIVGAIRAKKECLSCHEVKENDLLGAFSYQLLAVSEKRQRLAHADTKEKAESKSDEQGVSSRDSAGNSRYERVVTKHEEALKKAEKDD